MRRMPFMIIIALLALAAAGNAQTSQSAAPVVQIVPASEWQGLTSGRSAAIAERAQRLGSFFVVPYYQANLSDPNQASTLIAVRNEAGPGNLAEVRIFDTFGNQYLATVISLSDKETWTANFRDLLDGVPGVPATGVAAGYATVSALASVTVDYFQVDTANAFATGGAAFRTTDLCQDFRIRFLIGGGFSGGTQLEYYVPDPLGADNETDPPTITGTVYDESGAMINGFIIFTRSNAERIPSAALILPGHPFGSVDLRFENPGQGIVLVTHDALGQFSVRVPGFCLDSP